MKQDELQGGLLGDVLSWSFRLLFALVALLMLAWVATGISRVSPGNQAIVTRFGQIARVQGPGLLLTWPAPVEHVTLLPSGSRQVQFSPESLEQDRSQVRSDADSTTYGFDVSDDARQNTWFFMTGDGGLVHLKVMVFYQITDAAAWLIAADHIEPALRRAVIAAAVRTCASRDLDGILVARPERAGDALFVAKRESFRTDLVSLINARLATNGGTGLGIRVARADVVASIPSGAKAAFDNVLSVSQQVERVVAQARTAAELSRQASVQSRENALDQARARAQETVNTAEAKSAFVRALGSQPGMSRQTVLNQLYRERVGSVLGLVDKVDAVPVHATSILYSVTSP